MNVSSTTAVRRGGSPRVETPSPEAARTTAGGDRFESAPDNGASAAKWTVLAYLDGDNNLERFAVNALLQMERVGSGPELNLVAQLDRMGIPDELSAAAAAYEKDPRRYEEAYERYGDDPAKYEKDVEVYSSYKAYRSYCSVVPAVDGRWSGTRRYLVTKGSDDPADITFTKDKDGEPYTEIAYKVDRIASPCLEDLGEQRMDAKECLRDFLAWGMKRYPAEHYLVVVMDHGFGYMGSMADDTSKDAMSLPEMREALLEAEKSAGRKVDVLGFDSCLMGMAETAYELKDVAGVVVASQQFENAPGWPMAAILEGLKKGSGSPRDAAKMIIDEARKTPEALPTLAALDTAKMEKVKEAVDRLAGSLLDPSISPYFAKSALKSAKSYSNPLDLPTGDFRDLADAADKLAASPKAGTQAVVRDAAAVKDAVREAVIAEVHTPEEEGSHGLSIYAPLSQGAYDPYRYKNPASGRSDSDERFSYRKLRFAEGAWEKLLRTKIK